MMTFEGFVPPTKNYFPVPNNWIDICATIRDISELKVIQYVIRHTWGFHEFGICKTISVDEFMHGRRRQDQTRMDCGTGLSEQSVRNGLNKAIKDGYLICEVDPSDAGRIKKSYALRMQATTGQVQTLDPPQTLDPSTGTKFIPQSTNSYTSDSQTLDPRVPEFRPRTEKYTKEIHLDKDTLERIGDIVVSAIAENDAPAAITDLQKWKEESGKHPAITKDEIASHSQVDIGNFEDVDEEDFEGETQKMPAIPKQQKPDAGTRSFAADPLVGIQDDSASVQASSPGVGATPARRSGASPTGISASPDVAQGGKRKGKKVTQAKPAITLTTQEQAFWDLWCSVWFNMDIPPALNETAYGHIVKLAPHVKTSEQLNSLIDYTRKDLAASQNIKRKMVQLGNMVFCYSGWKQAQQKPVQNGKPDAYGNDYSLTALLARQQKAM